MKKIKSKNVQNYVMNDMVWKVDLPKFLKEISECSTNTPYGASFRILAQVLKVLTERAIEINDPSLNIIMLNLGLYEGAHDEKVDEVISQLRKLITDKQNRRCKMKKQKVFVLVQNGVDNQDNSCVDVVGVFSTKTAAKERMQEKKAEILDFYKEEYPDNYEVTEDEYESSWSCSCKDSTIYDELLITEKIVDED